MRRFLASVLLLSAPFAAAAEGVYVSEVGWAGSAASAADEWIELCGPAGADVSGWSIEGAGTGGAALALPQGSSLSASGSFLIANYAPDDARSTLDAAAEWVTTSVALSNSSLFLVLRDADGAFADLAGASGSSPLAGSSAAPRASMRRMRPLADGALASSWASAEDRLGFDEGMEEFGSPGTCQESAPPEPSPEPPAEATSSTTSTVEAPGAAESATTAAAAPPAAEPLISTARISEALPYPLEGGEEWIELVNLGTGADPLEGWTLEDGKGTSTPLSGMLLSWGHALFPKPKGQLNNDGDLILLKDARGRIVDGVAYGSWESTAYPNAGKVGRGETLVRVGWTNDWRVTAQPTPGTLNVLAETEIEDAEPAAAPTVTPVTQPAAATPPVPASMPIPTAAPAPKVLPTMISTPAPPAKAAKAPAAKKAPQPKYKGEAMRATILVPAGVYAKTRAYVLRDGAIEELRFSKTPSTAYAAGQELRFVAQRKEEGGTAHLLANPNSVTRLEAHDVSFAPTDALPEEPGAYLLAASFVSKRERALTVRAGDEELRVLLPAGTKTDALAFGDALEIRGFVDPEARLAVLASADALRVTKPSAPPPKADPPAKLPALPAVGLMLATGGVGMLAYLRQQRLQRAQVAGQAPFDEEA